MQFALRVTGFRVCRFWVQVFGVTHAQVYIFNPRPQALSLRVWGLGFRI